MSEKRSEASRHDVDLDKLESLLARSTRGPWEILGPAPTVSVYQVIVDQDEAAQPIAFLGEHPYLAKPQDSVDAQLIVAARNDMPALIARLRAAADRVKELEAAVKRFAVVGYNGEMETLADIRSAAHALLKP